MKILRAILYLYCIVTIGTSITDAQVTVTGDDPSLTHSDASEFDRALQKNKVQQSKRDQLLGQIALAQASSGDVTSSKNTLREIVGAGALSAAASQIQNQAHGGATGADFDSLINLITATVAPNSWEDVGGPGAIVEFPGGVFVDTAGVLHKSKLAKVDRRNQLDAVLASARQTRADDDPRRSSDLRMVSLTRLERELHIQMAFGEAPTEAMKHMAGIREIRYLFLFPSTNDCVIAGPAGDWSNNEQGVALGNDSPVVLLDDLVTLLKNAVQADGRFGCSITPKQSNLAATKRFLAQPTGALKSHQTKHWVEEIRSTLGLQNIDVHGIDPGSHVARLLIEADYHMKRIGMGLEPSVPGVPSYLDSIEPDAVPLTMDVLRWWFTLRRDVIQRNENGDAFVFPKQTVRLQSENERITDRGDRIHTGKSTALNQLFAARFTKYYDRLSKQYPVYAQLESLFRLSIVASLIQSDEVQSQIDWDPGWLISALSPAKGTTPREVPSIVNHRTVNRRQIVVGVSGGVSVNARRATASIRTARDIGNLASGQNTAFPRSPRDSERWWWD